MTRALTVVARALELGEPEGYVRIFDEGPAVTRLLVDGARRGVAAQDMGDLLEAIRSTRDDDIVHEVPSAAAPKGRLVEARLTAMLTYRSARFYRESRGEEPNMLEGPYLHRPGRRTPPG